MSLTTPLARVRGLGSAKDGTGHFIAQRLTAIANIPLVIWFVASAVSLKGATHADYVLWLSSPLAASLMILLVVSVFWHARLGLQVVIEDYVRHEGIKIASLALITLGSVALAVACIVAVLKVSLGGS